MCVLLSVLYLGSGNLALHSNLYIHPLKSSQCIHLTVAQSKIKRAKSVSGPRSSSGVIEGGLGGEEPTQSPVDSSPHCERQFVKNSLPLDQLTRGSCIFNHSSPSIILEEPVSVTRNVICSEWPLICIFRVQRREIAPALF